MLPPGFRQRSDGLVSALPSSEIGEPLSELERDKPLLGFRAARIEQLPEGLRHLIASHLAHKAVGEVVESDAGILKEIRLDAVFGKHLGLNPIENERLAAAVPAFDNECSVALGIAELSNVPPQLRFPAVRQREIDQKAGAGGCRWEGIALEAEA